MPYRIGKTWSFAAAHQLWLLPEGHKCARLHGHNYQVRWELEAQGLHPQLVWLLDYADLDRTVGSLVAEELDHRCLGCNVACPCGCGWVDHPHPAGLGHPTAEAVCTWLWQQAKRRGQLDQEPQELQLLWQRLVMHTTLVRVQETEKVWADYRPPGR